MKLIGFYRKPISLFVVVSFTILLCVWANPDPAATSPERSEKTSDATVKQGEGSSPNFIAKENATQPAKKKNIKFPWLLVAAGTVAVGIALYFLVIKKPQYTLTVNIGSGATGTPAATANYNKGKTVAYTYSLQAGYVNLQVKLDGVLVDPSGTVTMDKNHTLDVQTNEVIIGKRVVVAEEFTGTRCGLCPSAALGLDQLKKENPETLAVIAYHVPFESVAEFYNVDIFNARGPYYGIIGTPDVVFDGWKRAAGGVPNDSRYSYYKPFFDTCAAISPKVKYELSAQGNSSINVTIINVSGKALTGTFHFLIVEDNISYRWMDQDILRFVCRSMLPNAYGEAISLDSGQMKTINRTYTISSSWNRANCHIVAFVQGSNKEIYQGIEADLPAN